jgi:multicomponent Na+:H+ antiporter subunit E
MLIYLRWIAGLALVYLALTSNLEPSNIVVGLLLAGGVVGLVRPPQRPTQPRRPLRSAVALVRYVLTLIHDMVVSGLQVARIVLSPSLPIRPGIVAIPAETNTELGIALSAHAVSLTPGELVVEIDDDHMMYTHCLDATHAETYIKEAHDMRIELLNEIFP